MNKKILTSSFHWLIYQHKFLADSLDLDLPKNAKILEIGSGRYSSCGMYFDNKYREIHLGCYTQEDYRATQIRVESMPNFLHAKYQIKNNNIFDFDGKYDLVIMKSVLGGLFRNDDKAREKINELIKKIIRENLRENGYVITIDNGKTFLGSFFKSIGSRARAWVYLEPSDFKDYYYQRSFGFFSIGSFANRLRFGGYLFDFILYLIDRVLTFIGLNGTAQMITVFRDERKRSS